MFENSEMIAVMVAYCEADAIAAVKQDTKYGPIQAAIKSQRTVEINPVSLPQDPIYTQIVEVAPLELPIQIIYNSRSSPVLVHQNFIPGAPGQVERTSSQEEPHVVIHEVLRPVVQELREIITPYRRVVQEIAPVIETVNTIVAKGEGRTYTAPYSVSAEPVAEAKTVVAAAAPVGSPFLLKAAAAASSAAAAKSA